MKTYCQ